MKGRVGRLFFAGYAFLARSLQQIASFVITLLAAGFLLPAEYGVYTLGIAFIVFIQTMTYTGFYHFVVTSKGDDAAILSTTFWVITGLATAASALLAACAYPIARAFDAPDLGPVILLLALIQPLAGASAWWSAALLRAQALNLHFTVMFLQNAIALVGGAALLWLWQSLYALVAYRYLRVLSGALLYLAFAPVRPAFRFDRSLARRATGFSGGLYGARFLGFMSHYAADLLLGLVFTTAEAGLYRFGSRIAGGASDVISQPLRSFALTQFGAGARRGADPSRLLERFAGTITLMNGFVAAVIIVFADDVVATFFDPAYLAALAITYAMSVRGAVSAGAALLEPALSAQNRTGSVMVFGMIWMSVAVAAIALTAPLGLDVLAWSQAAVMAASTLWALVTIRRRGDIAIGGALRALALAATLSVVYGIAIWQGAALISAVTELSPSMELVVGLAWASFLAVPMIVLGWRLGVFSLAAFSG